MRPCPVCGASVDGTAAWCTSCGSALAPIDGKTSPGEPVAEAMGGAVASTVDDMKPLPAKESAKPAKQTHLDKGVLIDNKYEIHSILGEGGMGVVYKATDIHTGVDVVVKAIRPELAHRADIRERTLAEGRALARIDHPNVVHLNAVVDDPNGLWLVMQFIDGESLDKTIREANKAKVPVPWPDVLRLFRQILQGVAAAHQEGVIHRDLKPANILLRRKDGVAKVSDFGIAKPEDKAREGKGNTKGVIGSLWYMSPEQVQGKRDLDKRVDIYALGVLLYEMLVGRVPFDADSSYELMRKHVEDPMPSVATVRKDIPAWLDGVLTKACAKNREDRFASCTDFLTEIDRHVASEAPSVTHSASSVTASTEARSGFPWGVAIGFMAIAAVGTLGILYATGTFDEPAPRRRASSARPATDTTASSAPSATPSAAPSASVAPPVVTPEEALAALSGAWKSDGGRHFDAVAVGATLEFRIVDQKEFAPSDYRTGEARFILSVTDAATDTFTVLDRVRPKPPEDAPKDAPFEEGARSTCLEALSQIGDKPLLARYDGARLTIDFALIEPTIDNFDRNKKVVVGCKGLTKLKHSRTQSILER